MSIFIRTRLYLDVTFFIALIDNCHVLKFKNNYLLIYVPVHIIYLFKKKNLKSPICGTGVPKDRTK